MEELWDAGCAVPVARFVPVEDIGTSINLLFISVNVCPENISVPSYRVSMDGFSLAWYRIVEYTDGDRWTTPMLSEPANRFALTGMEHNHILALLNSSRPTPYCSSCPLCMGPIPAYQAHSDPARETMALWGCPF
jgi:hypothetical protein